MPFLPFPTLENASPVLSLVDAPDTFETLRRYPQPEGIEAIDYSMSLGELTFGNGTSTDPEDLRNAALARECRGMKIDPKTNEILARPYHKFFGVGQIADTDPDSIDWTRPHSTFNKPDGSMIHSIRLDGEVVLCTKKTTSRTGIVARNAMAFAQERHIAFASDMMDIGKTPLFEWCSNRNKIILNYPRENIQLTGVRDIRTGTYMSEDDMRHIGSLYGIDVVEPLGHDIGPGGITEFCATIRDLTETEGGILRFADGQMVKFKCQWYLDQVRTAEELDIRSEKTALQLILNNEDDDICSQMAISGMYARRDKLVRFATAVRLGILEYARHIRSVSLDIAERFPGDKKSGAMAIKNSGCPEYELPVLMTLLSPERDVEETITRMMLSRSHSTEGINQIRHLWGGLSWLDLRAEAEN